MRRNVPLVVVLEDPSCPRNDSVGHLFALDAAFEHFTEANFFGNRADAPGTAPSMIKPFNSVTVVVTPSALNRRRIIADAASVSNGRFKLFVTETDEPSYDLLPESFQLATRGRYIESMGEFEKQQQEQSATTPMIDEKIRFALLINCSQRLHDHDEGIKHSNAFMLVDMIQYCSAMSSTVPWQAVYHQLATKLVTFVNTKNEQTGTNYNMWGDRDFDSSKRAAGFIGAMMHTVIAETYGTFKASSLTRNHEVSVRNTQLFMMVGLVLASVGVSYYMKSS